MKNPYAYDPYLDDPYLDETGYQRLIESIADEIEEICKEMGV